MSSKYLKLALLTNDPFAVFLAAKEQEENKKHAKFDFYNHEMQRCKVDFRFEKQDILRLQGALGLPNFLKTKTGEKFSTLEGLCILLRRLAYPSRLTDLEFMFGRKKRSLSAVFNVMLDFIFDHHGYLLTSWNLWWLDKSSLRTYAQVIQDKGAPLATCFGFIDGTIHRICRPTQHQRESYSGHKRVHCLKYQSVVTPNGLIANLYGPIPGRRHDTYLLKQSGLLDTLSNHIGADSLQLYGDSGYPLKKYLITPYQGNNLAPNKLEFNKLMSKVRIAVEWEFGDLYDQFAFLSFKQNQKLFVQPVAKYYFVAAILKNCKTCLYGSQTSFYFNCTPPALEQYLANKKDI